MDLPDRNICYRAVRARDARFDGKFFTGVTTTGIYCRPICPARAPLLDSCTFWPSAAAAQAAGFRPCLRCRPELSPGVAAARGTANTVARALRLIDEGALDGEDVESLGARLGVSGRHLRRLFDDHLGASPVAVARARRALFAKRLIVETRLPITDIAFAAGFGSVRRFNDEIRRTFGRPPRALRKEGSAATEASSGITLTLAYRPPYDWQGITGFLRPRAIPGVEEVGEDFYQRSFVAAGEPGVVVVRPSAKRQLLLATIETNATSSIQSIVARLRALFDLDADPAAIANHLGTDATLAPVIMRRPGLRVPGAWDGFELGVRAIVGQQVSVAAATTFAGRIASRFGSELKNPRGTVTHVFPDATALIAAELDGLGLTQQRVRTIRAFAAYWASARALPPGLEATTAALSAIEGVGPWTAGYIAMRAGSEPDALPAGDLGLRKALARLGGNDKKLAEAAEAWRPWRAYAAMHLWASLDSAIQRGDP